MSVTDNIGQREALENLLRWAKRIRSYSVAMQAIGPITKDRFDGAIWTAEEVLSVERAEKELLTALKMMKALEAFERWWRLPNEERTIAAIEEPMRLCLEALGR